MVGFRASALVRSIAKSDANIQVLIAGEDGAGQQALADTLSAAYLCLDVKDGLPCGVCSACHAFQNQRAADLLTIAPQGKSDDIAKANIVGPKSDAKFHGPFVREFLLVPPVQCRLKVIVIHRVERFGVAAANALLKILEEPPQYSRFILTSNAASQISPTMRSRCVLIPCDFAEISQDEFLDKLAGGVPELVVRLLDPRLNQFVNYFREFTDSLLHSGRTQALKVSESFQTLAGMYADALEKEEGDGVRFRRAEVMKLLANWLAAMAAEGKPTEKLLEAAVACHHAITRNAHFGYACDALFASSL